MISNESRWFKALCTVDTSWMSLQAPLRLCSLCKLFRCWTEKRANGSFMSCSTLFQPFPRSIIISFSLTSAAARSSYTMIRINRVDCFQKPMLARCKLRVWNACRNVVTSSYFSPVHRLRKQAVWQQLSSYKLFISSISINIPVYTGWSLTLRRPSKPKCTSTPDSNPGFYALSSGIFGFPCHFFYDIRGWRRLRYAFLASMFRIAFMLLPFCVSCCYLAKCGRRFRSSLLQRSRSNFQIVKIYYFVFLSRAVFFFC